jgi:hypothetical protein
MSSVCCPNLNLFASVPNSLPPLNLSISIAAIAIQPTTGMAENPAASDPVATAVETPAPSA